MAVKWKSRTSLIWFSLFFSAVAITPLVEKGGRQNSTDDHHTDELLLAEAMLLKDQQTATNLPTAKELRLPSDIRPVAYNLTIKTYLPFYVDFPPEKNLTFDGEVEISMVALEPIERIVLNMKNITITSEKCRVISNNEEIGIKRVTEHEKLDKVEFKLNRTVEKDQKLVLKVTYSGLISSTLSGFYQATYVHTDGTTKIAAVTHMEPSYARQMVPCFDEPKYKANWTVTVIHPEGTRAVSNGIEKNGKGESGWIVSKFDTTPAMSSYLLAVLVSEFDYIEGHTKSGIRFRIWSRPEAKAMTSYALEAGIKCLEFYEQYFDITFPLRKQDMVALPDFPMGAMENWGLITYRESSLLYDDRFYSPLNKQRVALVVAHELAHQWFGNLVTLKWWDDLWLNEGFATFMESVGTDEISDKHFRTKDYSLLSSLAAGLHEDEVASSHPLSFQIDKATEVLEAFDSISYDKGASILAMLSAVIGEKAFKKAVTHYLKRFAYSNAQASDLWSAFDETLKGISGPRGRPLVITDFANQWTTQLGFPMVTAESFNETTIKITQKRYKINQKAEEQEKYRHPKHGFKWDVPLWYQENSEVEVKLTWLTRDEPLYLHLTKPNSTVVLNADRHGFYRQNYDAKGWSNIIRQLHENHEVYSARTRNAIISDAFSAALVNELEYETLFKLLEYSRNEDDYLPWEETINGLISILEFFGNEPESKPAKNYMRGIVKPIYDKANIENLASHYKDDKHFFQMNLQQSAIDTFCKLDSRSCLAQQKAIFDREVMQKCGDGQMASECVSVAAPLRSIAYCYGVKEGGDPAFNKAMELYKIERVQLEKERLLLALGCHNDTAALKGLLLLALDRNSSFVRLQDVTEVFTAVAATPVGEEFMFSFLLEHWEEIVEQLPTQHDTVEHIISLCASSIRSEQQVDQLKNLQKSGLRANEYGQFNQSIEKAGHRIGWIKKHFRKLSEFFGQATSS